MEAECTRTNIPFNFSASTGQRFILEPADKSENKRINCNEIIEFERQPFFCKYRYVSNRFSQRLDNIIVTEKFSVVRREVNAQISKFLLLRNGRFVSFRTQFYVASIYI